MLYINREIMPILRKSLKEHFYVSALIGPRQVGKTTLLNKLKDILEREYHVESRNIFYFNFDDISLRNKVKENFKYVLDEIEKILGTSLADVRGPIYLFIDEAQKISEIFDLVKIIFDESQEKVKIFLSGSSSFHIRKKSAETLAGRIRFFYLHPLAIRELINYYVNKTEDSLLEVIINGEFSEKKYNKFQSQIYKDYSKFIPVWRQSLIFGFLPKIFQLPAAEDKNFYLRDYINTYLEKDIRSLKEVGDIELFSKILSLFISQDSKLLNIAGISHNFDISRITLNKYFSILKETNVLRCVFPFIKQTSKKLVKSSKILFFDNGFINYETKISNLDQLIGSDKIGSIFENIIINNILNHISNLPVTPNVYFWRDYQGHEIDIVLENFEKIIPIEITYSSKISSKKLRNFRAFYELHKNAGNGFIVYSGDYQALKVGEKIIFAIPFWMWW